MLCSSVRAEPGAVGGTFCSTTKFKCIPLPSQTQHQTLHGMKQVSVHTQRYTPIPQELSPATVSYSMFNHLRQPAHRQHTHQQQQHFMEREVALKKSRSLQKAREVTPHRLHWSFYMTGDPVPLLNKDVEDMQNFDLSLSPVSQNPALYYGKGIKSGAGYSPRQLTRFEDRLRQVAQHSQERSRLGGMMERSLEGSVDMGRYSRTSRALTPGSPIPEEEPGTPPPPSPPHQNTSKTTFITTTRR